MTKHPFSHITISVFILFFLAFWTQLSVAQTSKIDSLLAVLETSKPDTNKVNILYHLSDVFQDNEPDKAIDYTKQGINLSEKLKFNKGINDCLNALGLAYYQTGNFDTALINFEKQYQIVLEMNDSMGIASASDNMGIIYVHMGNHDKALELRQQANIIYEALNKKSHLATGYTWIGNIYKEQGEYTTALENYLNALKIYENENDENNIGYPLLNISSIYRFMKQYDLAKKYALDAKNMFIKTNFRDGEAWSSYRLALIFKEEGDNKISLKYLKEADSLFEKTGNIYGQASTSMVIGNYYHGMSKNDSALIYFNYSFPLVEKMGDKSLMAVILQNIGTTYQDEHNYYKALEYMLKSDSILIEIKDTKRQREISGNLAELFSRTNQPDSVTKYLERLVNLSDSLYNDQNTKTIAEMQAKYETGKKEKEIELSAIKIRQQKSRVIFLTIVVIFLLLTSLLFYLHLQQKHKKNLLIATAIMERDLLVKEKTKIKIRNSVSDDTTKKILKKLVKEIETNKCYLDTDLKISDLAQRTGTNREYLSQIIHKTYDKNFNEFVNYYRVYESVEILKKIVSNGHENWTMETVAEKSGFKYTSTFNPAFKSVMNMSPTEFKKALKNM